MLEYCGADKDFSLDGKTAIVTGGAAGIGKATAEFLHRKGVNVVIADLDSSAEEIARSIGSNTIGLTADLTDDGYRRQVMDETVKKFGGIDILVNCAGVVALDDSENISDDMWDVTMNINLKASFKMAQLVGKYMIATGVHGSIVNMGSQAGVIALKKHVAYCASKGAVIAMTKVLALEWGEHGIRVNCVSPTVVMTELGHKAWDGPVGDKFKEQIPAKRFAEPDEVAGAIVFLCSGAAGMITGHNLLVDGGYTIQ